MSLTQDAPKLAKNNTRAIEEADVCSCFFCLQNFPASAIEEWVDDGDTALCPNCDLDTLLPGLIPPEELIPVCERWMCGSVDNLTDFGD